MTLKEFIQTVPRPEDKNINHVLDLLNSKKELPESIEEISKFVYLLLNREQTLAFQKILMMYFFTENNYQQPTNQNLDKINFIINLQNNDKNYPFK